MNKTENTLSSIGLAMGAIFGMSGSIFVEPEVLQSSLYEISSVSLVAATVLLTIKYLREGRDFIATGFLLFAIGEAIMTVGMPLGQVGGQPSFGAGMAIYVPALLFISLPGGFPLVIRFAGITASVLFAVAASKIFLGQQVLSTTALPGQDMVY